MSGTIRPYGNIWCFSYVTLPSLLDRFANISAEVRTIPCTDGDLYYDDRDGLSRNMINTTITTNSSTHTMGHLGQGGGGGSWGHRFFDFF